MGLHLYFYADHSTLTIYFSYYYNITSYKYEHNDLYKSVSNTIMGKTGID